MKNLLSTSFFYYSQIIPCFFTWSKSLLFFVSFFHFVNCTMYAIGRQSPGSNIWHCPNIRGRWKIQTELRLRHVKKMAEVRSVWPENCQYPVRLGFQKKKKKQKKIDKNFHYSNYSDISNSAAVSSRHDIYVWTIYLVKNQLM